MVHGSLATVALQISRSYTPATRNNSNDDDNSFITTRTCLLCPFLKLFPDTNRSRLQGHLFPSPECAISFDINRITVMHSDMFPIV